MRSRSLKTSDILHDRRGFTIVELLIVIVVIGILAAITVVAYGGIQERARTTKVKADFVNLTRAIMMARSSDSKTLTGVTGSGYTANSCVAKAAGTDLAALPKTDSCWTTYTQALDRISTASSINVRSLTDPWGRPYFIDENEGESGTSCSLDLIAVYAQPTNGNLRYPGSDLTIAHSGFSGCAL